MKRKSSREPSPARQAKHVKKEEDKDTTAIPEVDMQAKGSREAKDTDHVMKDKEPRVVIKKWHAVVFWSYDIASNTCPICHVCLICSQCIMHDVCSRI